MTTDNNEQSILEQAIAHANALGLTKEDAHATANECNYDLNCIKRILNEKAEKLKIAYDKKDEATKHKIAETVKFINEQEAKKDEEKSNKLRLQKLNQNTTQNVIENNTKKYTQYDEVRGISFDEIVEQTIADNYDGKSIEEALEEVQAIVREPDRGLDL